jgi:HK97 family phage major capsid protein
MEGFIVNKKEQELRQNVADLKAAAEAFMNENKHEEAKAKLAEAKEAKAALDNYLEAQNIVVPEPVNEGGIQQMEDQTKKTVAYKDVFLKALRKKELNSEEMSVLQEFKAAMVEGTNADGGYIVPEDISTRINELKQTVDNLEQYVTVEPVSTNKGQRTLEVRADSTPFAKMDELGNPTAMADMGNPQFSRVPFAIEDFAGFMPISNDLLNDTDQNLMSYIERWIAKKSKATRNSLILAQLNSLAKTAFADYKAIKTALNVTLDPAHAQNAVVMTNQDGFNYLDQLEDADNRPLLQPDPTSPTRKLLFGKPVVVLSNKTIATDGTGLAPVIVGDLKEAVVLFDRQQISIDMTKEGGNAWRSNSTELRAIEREDVVLWDDEAVVYGQIDVTPGV